MSIFYEDKQLKLFEGSNLDILPLLADNSIDSIVTDPPYHLTSITERFGKNGAKEASTKNNDGSFNRLSKGFMGKEWDGGDIAFNIELWKQCLRVLKPGGFLLAFSGTRTYHRMVVAIEDAGFMIKDQIGWLYGSGFPKALDISKAIDSHLGYEPTKVGEYKAKDMKAIGQLVKEVHGENKLNVGVNIAGMNKMIDKTEATSEQAKQWEGWKTALKPAWEPIVVAQKPLSEKTFAENILKWGVGAMNINDCRISEEDENGRYPANIIHDGSEEVSSAFPSTSKAGSLNKPYEINNMVYGDYGQSKPHQSYGDSGSASRFFYGAKAQTNDREQGLEEYSQSKVNDGRDMPVDNPYQRGETERKNIHPTVKPTDLMRYLVRLVTPKNGTVLDPFMGSGSTGKGALVENIINNSNYKVIGIEMTKDYLPIARDRIIKGSIEYAFEEQQGVKLKDTKQKEKEQLTLF